QILILFRRSRFFLGIETRCLGILFIADRSIFEGRFLVLLIFLIIRLIVVDLLIEDVRIIQLFGFLFVLIVIVVTLQKDRCDGVVFLEKDFVFHMMEGDFFCDEFSIFKFRFFFKNHGLNILKHRFILLYSCIYDRIPA